MASFEHQKEANRRSRGRSEFAYFMEMGTGKSKADIDDTLYLLRAESLDGWLITAPKGTYANWESELAKHLSPGLARTIHLWTGGGSKAQEKLLEAACRPGRAGHLRVFVVNVEALSSSKRAIAACEKFMKSCKRGKMTVDESTSIKNWRSERTKTCCWLGRMARWRRILTGMPVTKSPMDVFSQFEFLRPGMLGHRSWFSFRAAYAITREINVGARRVKIIVNFRNLDELKERVDPHSFRVTKEECLDLPPKIYQSRDVELTEEQQRVYREIRDDATTKLASGDHVTATEVITQVLRLHQVVCGHVVDESGETHDLPCARFDDLMALLAETSGKVIVWATYRRDVERIVRMISEKRDPVTDGLLYGPQSVVQYDGATSDAGRRRAVERFQGAAGGSDDPACRFFAGNPATGGFGLTLTKASTVIYFSNSYSLEKRMQSEDRAHRIGQLGSVNYVDLVARGTVDEKIISTLRRGIDIASTIVGDDYREWLV